jgi:hypothetical protein
MRVETDVDHQSTQHTLKLDPGMFISKKKPVSILLDSKSTVGLDLPEDLLKSIQ